MTNQPQPPKKRTPGTWYTSKDGEAFACTKSYPTFEAAVAGAPRELGIAPTESFYVGRRFDVRLDIGRFAEFLIRQAGEQAVDQVGDEAASWPGETETQMLDLRKRLQICFHAWMKDNGLVPTFFAISEMEMINGPA